MSDRMDEAESDLEKLKRDNAELRDDLAAQLRLIDTQSKQIDLLNEHADRVESRLGM